MFCTLDGAAWIWATIGQRVEMNVIAGIVSTAFALLAVVQVVRARRFVQGTSLVSARMWLLIASLFCLVSSVATTGPYDVPIGLVDHAWYMTAILCACPLIAVLGARRPGIAVWNWFVLLPLIAVLEWPAASQFLASNGPKPLQLSTPAVAGFSLVLAMGTGNYLGTRLAGPVSLAVLGIVTIVATVSEWWTTSLTQTQGRMIATVLIGLSGVMGIRTLSRSAQRDRESKIPAVRGFRDPLAPASVWNDFVELYGIVWARRVVDRINVFGDREKWPARMTMQGLSINDETAIDTMHETEPRIHEVVRWVLRRFVDAEWIDERIARSSTSSDEQATAMR